MYDIELKKKKKNKRNLFFFFFERQYALMRINNSGQVGTRNETNRL